MEGILLDESSRVASFDGKKRETRDIDKFERRTSFFFVIASAWNSGPLVAEAKRAFRRGRNDENVCIR